MPSASASAGWGWFDVLAEMAARAAAVATAAGCRLLDAGCWMLHAADNDAC